MASERENLVEEIKNLRRKMAQETDHVEYEKLAHRYRSALARLEKIERGW